MRFCAHSLLGSIAIGVTLSACAAPIDDATTPPAGDVGAVGSAMVDPPRDDDGASGADRLLAEARRELGAMRTSIYSHDTFVDESTGTFDYDCSGFLGYALGRSLPGALADAQGAVFRPLAATYERFFESLAAEPTDNWRSVRAVKDLVPGDVVAWLQAPSVPSSNTGHVVIVRERPERGAQGEWRITIIDSTASPHGASDSRSEHDATGLGTGRMVLVEGDGGAPRAYRWSTWSQSPIVETRIAMAHPR